MHSPFNCLGCTRQVGQKHGFSLLCLLDVSRCDALCMVVEVRHLLLVVNTSMSESDSGRLYECLRCSLIYYDGQVQPVATSAAKMTNYSVNIWTKRYCTSRGEVRLIREI